MFYPPLIAAKGPFPRGRSLIEPTGRFKTRVVPPKPPENFKRPFTRWQIVKAPLSPITKLFLVWEAWAAGLIIGSAIRNPVRNFIGNLLDPAQPYKFKPDGQYRDVDFEDPYNATLSVTYLVTYKTTSLESSRYRCDSNERVEKASESVTTNQLEIKNAYGLRYSTKRGVAKLVCSGGADAWTKVITAFVESADKDGAWSTQYETEANEGTQNSQFYYDGQDEKWVEITGVEKDGETVQVPSSFVVPDPEPLPEVDEETTPERQRVPLPVIAPPLPATVPSEPLPDEEGERKRRKVPAPPIPATAPVIAPAPVPDNAEETDKEGDPVPPKLPPVPTTPKDVHIIGNKGDKIFGRTMRPSPVGIAQEVGRIEQKISGMNRDFPTLGGLGDILRLLLGLTELLNQEKPGTKYELNSVCECPSDEEGCEEETTTVSTGGGYYVDEILARIDAIPPLLQAHKDYKQPICDEKPELQGDFRTISFISDERTTAGDRYLSKRFRYRSQSGTSLDGLVNHWKDFTWTAGPVCVQHSGHPWGTPQVWAATSDEGKRVIQHAGREAGIDPSEVGKWTVSGSNNPRFGLSGRMRVNTKGGYYWITERLGSDQRPLVVST